LFLGFKILFSTANDSFEPADSSIIDFSPSSSLATGKYAAALADARRAAEIEPGWAKPRARIGDAVRE
jgi:hypothetical protein